MSMCSIIWKAGIPVLREVLELKQTQQQHQVGHAQWQFRLCPQLWPCFPLEHPPGHEPAEISDALRPHTTSEQCPASALLLCHCFPQPKSTIWQGNSWGFCSDFPLCLNTNCGCIFGSKREEQWSMAQSILTFSLEW